MQVHRGKLLTARFGGSDVHLGLQCGQFEYVCMAMQVAMKYFGAKPWVMRAAPPKLATLFPMTAQEVDCRSVKISRMAEAAHAPHLQQVGVLSSQAQLF